MENNKESRLIFDMKLTRKLLKQNPTIEPKYCRYCGKLLADNCSCQQPLEIIDVKPLRDNPKATIAIFKNTPEFQVALNEVIAEFQSKKHGNTVPEE